MPQYYAKDGVREPHVTNPFFAKRNIGYGVLEWKEHIAKWFCHKRISQTVEHPMPQYYAKGRVREPHVTNPFFVKQNIGY